MSLSSTAPGALDARDYAQDWALVDVETSGLAPRQHRVLSIAVLTIGPDGQQTGEFSTLLNPGCDPGPVHVHGLTAERLRGAPTFEQVAGRIGAMLRGRVLVAHNAQFDYDFLAHEFARAGMTLPVARRLCTLALNRQVDPPTENMRLGTLAAHYGVPQLHAHDALDDTRVLAGILKATLREAARLDLPLPLVDCPGRQNSRFTPQPPKATCAFRNPGRLTPGGPLTQGMKIAITGETDRSRAELVGRAVSAGLNMMNSVNRHTGALVTNDGASGSAKARRAIAEGVPVINEDTFLRLLSDVRPGTLHERRPSERSAPVDAPPPVTPSTPPAPVAASVPLVPAPREPQSEPAPDPAPVAATPGKPLAGQRVLVLGGTHPNAAATRTRVVELGGSAAVNLSASVTDVVVLPGGDSDRRMPRITSLELPTHDTDWLSGPVTDARSHTVSPGHTVGRGRTPRVLPRGGVVDLPDGTRPDGALPDGTPSAPWAITATWAQQTACEIDVVAFILDEDEQVTFDEDFIFYGAPESPAGTVRLFTDGPTEQTITTDLAALPPAARKVVIAAAIDGTTSFGDVGAIQITAAPGSSAAPLAQAALDAATTERTMLLAELYRRGSQWRFRAVGQGYNHGLDALARGYGVDVAN